jgi:uncharacterized tellurite resistance protein B-like protein
MSLLDFLGIHRSAQPAEGGPALARGAGETETVRKIVRELESLPRDRARYLAAFAFVLGRTANADRVIDESETRAMERLVRELAALTEEQAVLVVAIAKSQNQLFGGTESYLVTRELCEVSTPAEREYVLHSAFAVAAADDSISSAEEAQLRQIASELGFSNEDYVRIRSAYNDKRAVVQLMRATALR